jgi:hypothetical protein
MMRILGVVVAFVVLDAGGFFIYRASLSVDAATISPSMIPHTLAREPSPSQPKLDDVPRPHATTNVEQTPIAEPTEHFTEPAVLPHTAPPRVNAEIKRSRPRVEATSRAAPQSIEVEAPVKDKRSIDPAPKPEKNNVLEMEGNPYKRGE